MAKIKKEDIDLNATVVNLKILMRGSREYKNISCTVAQACDFVDFLNENKFKVFNKHEKEMMKNKYYIFDDIVNKKTVLVSFRDIKYIEIPYVIDDGKDSYDIKILTCN